MSSNSTDIAVKIYGERNSGTNFLHALVARNLKAEILTLVPGRFESQLLRASGGRVTEDLVHWRYRKRLLGWKHGCPPLRQINQFRRKRLVILTITKNPYAFALSLHRRPYHMRKAMNLDFCTFLEYAQRSSLKDNCPRAAALTPIDLWNIKNRAYVNLGERSSCMVVNLSYERVLQDPAAAIHTIANQAQIARIFPDRVQQVRDSTKDSTMTFDDYRRYYLDECWKSKLSPRAIEAINRRVDRILCAHFGYSLLNVEKSGWVL